MTLRITMLGSGTSVGVPVVGCPCGVCTSENPRNTRLRTSLRLELPGGVALIDTSTDLRQQALQHAVHRVDAVIYTHAHADHVLGLDDLRIYNLRQKQAIPCYGSRHTLASVRRMFAYVFDDGHGEGFKPQIELVEVAGPFELLGARFVPVPVCHGDLEVFGYRVGNFAYVTDCSRIPQASYELLEGVETLILGALRYRSHPTHFNVSEAIQAALRIGAKRTYLTHLSHEINHEDPQVPLPRGVEFGYDGLSLQPA